MSPLLNDTWMYRHTREAVICYLISYTVLYDFRFKARFSLYLQFVYSLSLSNLHSFLKMKSNVNSLVRFS